jgi:hypothetical protein
MGPSPFEPSAILLEGESFPPKALHPLSANPPRDYGPGLGLLLGVWGLVWQVVRFLAVTLAAYVALMGLMYCTCLLVCLTAANSAEAEDRQARA